MDRDDQDKNLIYIQLGHDTLFKLHNVRFVTS